MDVFFIWKLEEIFFNIYYYFKKRREFFFHKFKNNLTYMYFSEINRISVLQKSFHIADWLIDYGLCPAGKYDIIRETSPFYRWGAAKLGQCSGIMTFQ